MCVYLTCHLHNYIAILLVLTVLCCLATFYLVRDGFIVKCPAVLCFMYEHVLGFVRDVSSSLADVTCSSFMYFIVFMSVTDIHLCYVK